MKYYLIEDICVCCGAPVPEGTMVCPICQKKYSGNDMGDFNRSPEKAKRPQKIHSFWKHRGRRRQ